MKTFFRTSLVGALTIFSTLIALSQTEGTAVWQVTKFDVNANVQQSDRTLNGTVTINAVNVGNAAGSTFTVRVNTKASVKSANVAGATASFRAVPETRGDLQRIVVSLPGSVAPNGSTSVTINYSLPVAANTGLAAISPVSSQFLPLAYWYPMPNTPLALRGVDTAPFRVSVNLPNVVSSGVDKSSAGSAVFEQTLSGQPFFLQGDWEKLEGAGEGKGIVAYVTQGASADEKKRAEAIIAYTAAARAYLASALGPAPDVPVRLVAARRGSGFSDTGTILLDADIFKLPKLDTASALAIAEAIARLWLGGQTPIRGEGAGALRDGLVRFLANAFLEKQFGREAAESELIRQRLAYIAVAKRDGPLARANSLDTAYFGSVPNRGAMTWRLIDRKLGHDVFIGVLRSTLETGKTDTAGLTLPIFRAALVNRGGESLRTLLDQQLDQVPDTDLMIGLPQARNAEWTAALRNLGSTDITAPVAAITDRGEKLTVEVTVPAKNFGEAVFKTTNKVVRVEIDPDKLYPQLDYSNDAAPRGREITDALAQATLQLGAQDFVKAEASAREIFSAYPRLQEARILLARALLGEGKLEEAERLFRSGLDDPLPSTATLAWANIGLGEISLKRGQAVEAVKRLTDAVIASRDYPSSLAARLARIRAEAAANNAPPVDESARTFIAQLTQAIMSGKKAELESRVVSGELVRFVNGIVGTQPEIWETKVIRTELLDANQLAADVTIRAKQLGKESSGTAVLVLSRTAGAWKLSGVELFEVR
ncbi:MAG TPA: tetratricopeptide repeat protein [Pyrinomonadaceae bacterium]|nr:tetratricopeptide repeat protein [Pyrinomonadaceae bacterium]